MENNIDKLQLDISVTGNAARSAKDINNLATAISNLQNKVGKSLEFTGIKELTSDIKDVTVSLKDLSASALLKIADDKEIAKGKKLSELLGEIKFKYDDIIKSGGKLTEKQSKELEAANRGILELATSAREDVVIKPPKIKIEKPVAEKEAKSEQKKAHKDEQSKTEKQKGVKPPQVKQGQWKATRYGGFIREDKIPKELSEEVESSKKLKENNKKGIFYLIKRFSLYRAIRGILQQIVTFVREGIEAVAEVSPTFGKTLNELNGKLMQVKASIGVISAGILQMLAPAFGSFSDKFADIANKISLANAVLNKNEKYVSVNTQAWAKYKKAINGALLSFDTFTTLNAEMSLSDFMDEKAVSETTKDEQEAALNLQSTIKDVIGTVKTLATALTEIVSGIIVPIINSGVVSWLTQVTAEIITVLNNIGLLKGVVLSIIALKVVSGIAKVASGIKIVVSGIAKVASMLATSLNPAVSLLAATIAIIAGYTITKSLFATLSEDGKKAASIIGIVTGSAMALLAVLIGIKGTMSAGLLAISAAGIGIALASVQQAINSFSVKKYANGGIMEGAGTLYSLAGESGAEIVAQGSQGTGVANVKQIAEAVYQGQMRAFIDYNAARGDMSGMSFDVDGYRLGQMVARNDGFINAVRQKNPTLNFR